MVIEFVIMQNHLYFPDNLAKYTTFSMESRAELNYCILTEHLLLYMKILLFITLTIQKLNTNCLLLLL